MESKSRAVVPLAVVLLLSMLMVDTLSLDNHQGSDMPIVSALPHLDSTETGQSLYSFLKGPPDVPGFGTSLEDVGDLQGDGLDDLIIASSYPFRFDYMEASGVLPYTRPEDYADFLLYGKSDGQYNTAQLEVREGMPSYFRSREICRWMGDVNGDGFNDVVTGPVQGGQMVQSEVLNVSIWYGSSEGLSDNPRQVVAIPFHENCTDIYAVAYVRGAGDINGDGYDDLLYYNIWHNPSYIWYEDIRVYFGGPGGISTTGEWRTLLNSSDITTQALGMFQAADFNGDGCSDITCLISQAYENSDGSGRVFNVVLYVFYGSPKGLSDRPATTIRYTDWATSIQDLPLVFDYNGDRCSDLLVLNDHDDIDYTAKTRRWEKRADIYLGTPHGLDANWTDRLFLGHFVMPI